MLSRKAWSTTPRDTTIRLPASAVFAIGKSSLADGAGAIVIGLVQRLASGQLERLVVNVHSDSKGKRSDNLRLTEDRAVSLGEALADAFPGAAVTSVGHGSRSPIAKDVLAADRDANRRVELVISRRRG